MRKKSLFKKTLLLSFALSLALGAVGLSQGYQENHLLAGLQAGGSSFYGYDISQSLRFNDDDSAYLSKTPAGAGNRKTWIFGAWLKVSSFGSFRSIFAATNGAQHNLIDFGDGDTFRFYDGGTIALSSSALYRDSGSWYSLLVFVDTTQATEADRVKAYVNGSELSLSGSYPSQEYETQFNTAIAHGIGWNPFASGNYFDGIMSQVFFINDQSLVDGDVAITDFGTFVNGVWTPKDVSSLTFGTNGFLLDFADSGDIGNDVSGNGNDWTPTNLAATDVVTDSPTNNFCVWNVLKPSSGTFADGNLAVSGTEDAIGTFGVSSGKWSWKVTVQENGSFGIENDVGTEYSAADVSGEVVEFELDLDNLTLKKRVDGGGLETVQDPVAAGTWFPLAKAQCLADFGQVNFTPTDTNFLTLCSANLSDPSWMADSTTNTPADAFDVVTRTGTGAAASISSLNFSSDILWIKNRDQADSHYFHTTEHTDTDYYTTIDTAAGETQNANSVTSFDANGYSLGTGEGGWNDDTENFVDFSWLESATYGVDLVKAIGTGANATLSHNLGVTPDMIIAINLSAAHPYWVYHSGAAADPETDYLVLDTAGGLADDVAAWNDTAPTSTEFTVGTSDSANKNTCDMLYVLFASIEGFSKFGYYTGNANADGPFIYTGFRVRWLLAKEIGAGQNWVLVDAERSPYNQTNLTFYPELPNAESANMNFDFLSNGFKVKQNTPNINNSGIRIIYAAFAEFPFKYANAR